MYLGRVLEVCLQFRRQGHGGILRVAEADIVRDVNQVERCAEGPSKRSAVAERRRMAR